MSRLVSEGVTLTIKNKRRKANHLEEDGVKSRTIPTFNDRLSDSSVAKKLPENIE